MLRFTAGKRLCRVMRQGAFVLLMGFAVSGARAQDIPSAADPSRVENRLPTFSKPPVSSLSLPQKEKISVNAPDGAQGYRFVLSEVQIEGARVYGPEDISAMTASYAGREVSVADIYQLAADITARYHEDGYILAKVFLPEQEIDGGVVRLSVVEGYIGEVFLTGEAIPSFPGNQIVRHIETSPALNIHQLERQLLLMDEIPGINIRAILEPLPVAPDMALPGGVALRLVAEKDSNAYFASVDNNGSRYVGPWQGGVQAQVAHGGLVPGDIRAAYYTTPQRSELTYLSLSDHIPVSGSGLKLVTGVDFSRSEPGSVLDESDVWSRYLSLKVGLEYPVILSRQNRLDAFTQFEYNNIDSTLLSTRFYDDRVRVLRAGVRYLGYHALGETRGDFSVSQGLDIFGARDSGSIDLSRAQGRSDFTKTSARLVRTQYVTDDFQAKISLAGQYGFSPLLSSEEFGFGGGVMGRGYDPSEITGDRGVGFSAELSYKGISFVESHPLVPSIEPFVFYDIGKVWNLDNGQKPESAASAGVGVRLGWEDLIYLNFTVAQPLTRAQDNPLHGNPHSPRFLAGLQFQF
jgi:hemolysin activation/secretion protein